MVKTFKSRAGEHKSTVKHEAGGDDWKFKSKTSHNWNFTFADREAADWADGGEYNTDGAELEEKVSFQKKFNQKKNQKHTAFGSEKWLLNNRMDLYLKVNIFINFRERIVAKKKKKKKKKKKINIARKY